MTGLNGTVLLAVGVGSLLGAYSRLFLALLLNPLFPDLPPGTLAANLIGALLMGIALGCFEYFQALDLATRLLITTGFLGGLTTFSTFSAESVLMLDRGRYLGFAVHAGLHVFGSIAMTIVGLAATRALLRR